MYSGWSRELPPDGYGVILDHGVRKPFYLEYDRGTETIGRLIAKLLAYRDFPPGTVLFRFQTPTREENFLRRAESITVPLAASNVQIGPAIEPIWRKKRQDLKTTIEKGC